MNLLERRHIARLGKELDPDSSLSFPFCPEHHLDGGVGGDDDDLYIMVKCLCVTFFLIFFSSPPPPP